jgi:ABC-2 type transport system permease protein
MTIISTLVGVTLRGLLSRRRIILLVLLAAIPVLIALLVRLSGGQPLPDRVLDTLVVRAVMPLTALILGTAALGSEIEDGTAVFQMVKPIPRWQILVSKMLVAAGLTALLVVPSIVLTGVLIGRATTDALTTTTAFAVACLIGGTAYSVAFVTLSLYTSRALLVGLGYTLIWEGVLSGLLEGTKFLSIRQATLGIAAALGAKVPGTPLTLQVSVLVVTVVIVGAFVLGTWKLARFEIRAGD